jgi:hypothetical protein
MIRWEYRVERIEYPLTKSDAQAEKALLHLQNILKPETDTEFFERELGDLLGHRTGPKNAEDHWNELGRDGWELVSIYPDGGNAVAIFKKKSA